uniref:Protein root UVB sensitive/RUS domain-containing protein n=1 Tax=Guillardia theta TaxID=55529 RepID=A0A7S4KRI5_GUITH|mmetsp:Transcript_29614/g.94813  ORF Transcript_29614/g.94813 Transcript_29614/m.94813 type:complete len:565 (+) Transcript_29614:51-1745(+)
MSRHLFNGETESEDAIQINRWQDWTNRRTMYIRGFVVRTCIMVLLIRVGDCFPCFPSFLPKARVSFAAERSRGAIKIGFTAQGVRQAFSYKDARALGIQRCSLEQRACNLNCFGSSTAMRSSRNLDASGTLDSEEREGPEVYDVRLDGSQQKRLRWDARSGKFIADAKNVEIVSDVVEEIRLGEITSLRWRISAKGTVRKFVRKASNVAFKVKQSFLPRGVSEDYYSFTIWRILQRIVSSTVSVFGTQSLLLALGVKTNKVGVAAASGWVFANAFGKFGKMIFAARWGRDFDSDAKRWRFRAALMWVFANGMEILTFVIQEIFTNAFTVLVAISVCLKQVSILTTSATRGTFYKQFAGRNENLGDITAKGDAQVAVADLVGLVVGIELARLAGTNALCVWGSYVVLSALDFIFILKSLDTIVFRFLNLERATMLASAFVSEGIIKSPADISRSEPVLSRPRRAVPQNKLRETFKGYWASTFRSISQTRLRPQELGRLVHLFRDQAFMLVYTGRGDHPCVVLKQSAKDLDILQSLLALEHFRLHLSSRQRSSPALSCSASSLPSP